MNTTTTKRKRPLLNNREVDQALLELEQVTAQRDELLAAAKLAIRAGITYSPDGIKAVAAIKAAITKAEQH